MAQKTKKNGTAFIAVILIAFVMIGIVVFLFFSLRPPPEPPEKVEATGLDIEAVQEAIQEVKEESEEKEKNYPVAKVLPYGGPFDGLPFLIQKPQKDGTIVIMIDEDSNFEQTQEAAENWIKSQGYNPDDYTFDFRTKSFPE